MKPWEETWEAQRYVIELADDAHRGRSLGQFIDDDDDPKNPSVDRDRAQLASAAPEMARLLLELEWAGYENIPYDGCEPACAVCGANPRDVQEIPPRTGINHTNAVQVIIHSSGHHAPDCRLVAVLRKAGVLRHGEEP